MSNLKRTFSGGALAGLVAVSSFAWAVQPAAAVTTGSVVAIGDSYPAGSEGNEGNAYPERTTRLLDTPYINLWSDNQAHGGWTTNDVIYQFNHSDVLRRIATANTVIITIGANDIDNSNPDPRDAAITLRGYRPGIAAMQSRLNQILNRVSAARHGNNKRVVVTTYNNLYLGGAPMRSAGSAFVKGSMNVTKAANAAIMQSCQRYAMTCADVMNYFYGSNTDRLVTSDGTHPSSAGHQMYANRIFAAMLARR